MLIKAVIFFLLAMLLLGMIGKALFPAATQRKLRRMMGQKPAQCPRCTRPIIGKSCGCTKREPYS